MECHGYNINPNHQCTMDHLSIIWAHFELQMILCMVKCQTNPQCSEEDYFLSQLHNKMDVRRPTTIMFLFL